MNAIYAQEKFRQRAVSSAKLNCGEADGTEPKAQQSFSKLDIRAIYYLQAGVCKVERT